MIFTAVEYQIIIYIQVFPKAFFNINTTYYLFCYYCAGFPTGSESFISLVIQ
jgi:hypothetical protein